MLRESTPVGNGHVAVPRPEETFTNTLIPSPGFEVYVEVDVWKAYDLLRASPRNPKALETLWWAERLIYHPVRTSGDHTTHLFRSPPKKGQFTMTGNVAVNWNLVTGSNPALCGIGGMTPYGMMMFDGFHRLARAAQSRQSYWRLYILNHEEFWSVCTKWVEYLGDSPPLTIRPMHEPQIRRVSSAVV